MNAVLVIDDDPVVRAVVQRVLEGDGFSVAAAADAQTGLCLYGKLSPDLVIVDILMPGKEGIATILDLRELNPDARILAITGGGSFVAAELLRIAELVGADNTLEKPFSPDELLSTVKRSLA